MLAVDGQPKKKERAVERHAGGHRLSEFARRLLAEWKRLALPAADARIVVAVSGGADSTALLLALDELSKAGRLALGIKVAHLDHGLRETVGDDDARWVGELATRLGYVSELGRAAVGAQARARRDNLEQAARRARYAFLKDAARAWNARLILTAHTLDDQAETVLLALVRGSGAEGLGGISPVRALAGRDGTPLRLVRPLVRWARRAETEKFCLARNVAARVDEMNADERFARVRIRRMIVPLLETFNPRAVEAIARAAELLRDDAATLETQAAKLLAEASRDDTERQEVKKVQMEKNAEKNKQAERGGALPPDERVGDGDVDEPIAHESLIDNDGAAGVGSLGVDALARAVVALRRRALRQWLARGRGDLRRIEMTHVLAVERLVEGTRGGRVAELPGGGRVVRRRGRLYLEVGAGGRDVEMS